MCVLLHVCELLCLFCVCGFVFVVLCLWFCVCGFVFVMGCESESGMIVRREILNEKESATEMDVTVYSTMNMRLIAESP